MSGSAAALDNGPEIAIQQFSLSMPAREREVKVHFQKTRPFRGHLRCLRMALTALLMTGIPSSGQVLQNSILPAAVQEAGFHISNVSVFGSYSNINDLAILTGAPNETLSGHGFGLGVSTSVGWSSQDNEKNQFSISYAPSYTYSISSSGYPNIGRLSQGLNFGWTRKLSEKWTLGTSASASMGSFNDLVLNPSTDQLLTALPGTGQQLAGAVLLGQGTNQGMVSTATGASALISPEELLLYGGRILSASASTSLAYAFSPRLGVSVSLSGSRIQHLSDGNASTAGTYLVNQSTAAAVAVSLAYELSTRTNVGGSFSYFRAISPYGAPSGSAHASFGHEFTEHFFVGASAGVGYISGFSYESTPTATGSTTDSTSAAAPATTITSRVINETYSGKAGYRTFNNTFMVSVGRSLGDYYAVGSTGSFTAAGAWSYSPPGASWGLTASFGESRFLGPGWGNNNGYHTTVGLFRRVSDTLTMSLQYGYSSFSGAISDTGPVPGVLLLASGQSFRAVQQSLRCGISWGWANGWSNNQSRAGLSTP
jgi:hypothetical protein